MPGSQNNRHEFEVSIRRKDKIEDIIAYLKRTGFDWLPATNEQQKNGIDGIVTCRKTNRQWSVEVKSDSRAAETGNIFVETVSVDVTGQPGWAYTSLAQVLFYYIPPLNIAYVAYMTKIKELVCGWESEFHSQPIPNSGYYEDYQTTGLLIPLKEFLKQCRAKKIILTN